MVDKKFLVPGIHSSVFLWFHISYGTLHTPYEEPKSKKFSSPRPSWVHSSLSQKIFPQEFFPRIPDSPPGCSHSCDH